LNFTIMNKNNPVADIEINESSRTIIPVLSSPVQSPTRGRGGKGGVLGGNHTDVKFRVFALTLQFHSSFMRYKYPGMEEYQFILRKGEEK